MSRFTWQFIEVSFFNCLVQYALFASIFQENVGVTQDGDLLVFSGVIWTVKSVNLHETQLLFNQMLYFFEVALHKGSHQ